MRGADRCSALRRRGLASDAPTGAAVARSAGILPGYALPGGLRHRTGGPHFRAAVIGGIEIEDEGGRSLLGPTQTQAGV
jgi:hypothetical protein